jgi:uncharacterized protein YbjQ (UPF0145 family)
MIVTTTGSIRGKRIVRTLGLVRGNTIRARHIGKDIMAGLRNVVGGEIAEYTKLFAQAREQALDRMVDEARDLGANAILEIRFSTSMVMSAAAELLVYGTAVVVVVPRRAGKARDRGIAVPMAQGAQRRQRGCGAARYVPVLVVSNTSLHSPGQSDRSEQSDE